MNEHLKNSKTKENLMRAFAGESQARNRYTFAADTARKQGMAAIAQVFEFTAGQERAHAERFYNLLKDLAGENIEITGGYPVDLQPTIEELLKAATHNEYEEADDVYMAFAETAKEEGILEASSAFWQIARIEKMHGNRFAKLVNMLEDSNYYQQPEGGEWMCLNCGHIHKGMLVPEVCPVCRYEKGYFIPVELAPYTSQDLRQG